MKRSSKTLIYLIIIFFIEFISGKRVVQIAWSQITEFDIGWHGVLPTLKREIVDIQQVFFVYNLVDLFL